MVIKFRGYCQDVGGDDPVMLYSGDFIEDGEGIICWSFDNNGIPCLEVPILVDDDRGGNYHDQYISYTTIGVDKGLRLMLYTNYTDKHKKEIYESDIVQVYFHDDKVPVIGEVFFDAKRGCWNIKDRHGRTYFDYHPHSSKTPFESIREIEVLGNIYENSDYLKEKQ